MTTHISQLQTTVFIFASLVLFFLFSNISEAYFTTAQSAQKIGDSILFTIDYSFGSASYDMELPILAKRQITLENDYVSYEIYDDAEPEKNDVVAGEAFALVLSDAPITDDITYEIEDGESRNMTLFVLFKPENPSFGDKYSLQVEALPFKIGGTQNKLNNPELRPYTTKLISW